MATKQTSTANPFLDMDFSKFIGDMRVPSMDVDAMMASQRKNIEAMTSASQLAFEGMQTVMRRQVEMMRQQMEEGSSLVRDAMAEGTPEEKVARNAELTRKAYDKALANLRELSELASKSQHDATDVLSKRFGESLTEIKTAAESRTNGAAKQ